MNEIGRYRVERRLGSGAFAVVWLCHDDALDVPVAIKVLADNWSHQIDVRSRFVEEARLLRRADSARLVRVLDMGELPNGRPYFVMAYADRGTLADRLVPGPLPVGEALSLAVEVARGVDDLHELGVIHRDLKPSNVLFQSTNEGGERVLVADLGLAKSMAHASGLTLAAGTPGYMAPEQAQPSAGLDLRADVHALGALAYHLLTGSPPAPLLAPGAAHEAPSARRAGLPGSVDEVVLRALAPDREARWPSAAELAGALEALRADLPRDLARAAGGKAAAGTARTERAAVPAATASTAPVVETAAAVAETAVPVVETAAAEVGTKVAATRRPGRRRVAVIAAAVLLACTGATGAAVLVPRLGHVRVGDGTGQLSIVVPRSWARQVRDDGWSPSSLGLSDDRGAALAVAPELDRWPDPDSDTPGVFVGLTTDLREGELPPKAAAHPGCTAAGQEPYERAGLRGVIVRWASCGSARMSLSEVGLYDRDRRYAVYVQVKQPAGADRTTEILDTLQVTGGPASSAPASSAPASTG